MIIWVSLNSFMMKMIRISRRNKVRYNMFNKINLVIKYQICKK